MVKYTAAQKRAYAKRKSAQKKFILQKPKPSVTRQMQPIVETKKYATKIVDTNLSTTSAADIIVPDTFMWMNRQRDVTGDLLDSAIEGRDIFSRFLSMKIEVAYPFGSDAPSEPCRPVELVWGWVNPLNLTEFTTPAMGTITTDQIISHVNNAVAADFNDADEFMEFKDRKKRLYNIIGRKFVRPDLRKQLPHAIVAGSWADSAAPIQHTLSWPMKKKVRYEHSKPGITYDNFSYPNEAYVPFVVAYNVDYDKYTPNGSGVTGQIALRISNCHWFNDN